MDGICFWLPEKKGKSKARENRQEKTIKTKKVYVLKRKPFFAGAEGRN
jgi:hypothetical protein